jgi:NADH-quinone oxidoreductase subunit C
VATHPDGASVRGLDQEVLAERVLAHVREAAGEAAAAEAVAESFRGQSAVRLPSACSLEVLRRLRDDPELAFEMLTDVTCVHFPRRSEPLGAFDVVYHLTSLSKGHRIRLKVACSDPDEGVESACPVWEGANLLEREAYDMFGLRFRNHPDLRRILMDENFDGWPLRKDFPFRGR